MKSTLGAPTRFYKKIQFSRITVYNTFWYFTLKKGKTSPSNLGQPYVNQEGFLAIWATWIYSHRQDHDSDLKYNCQCAKLALSLLVRKQQLQDLLTNIFKRIIKQYKHGLINNKQIFETAHAFLPGEEFKMIISEMILFMEVLEVRCK